MDSRLTQRARILQVLLEARGQEVPLADILDLRIGQYGSRLLELRRLGFKIRNRTQTIDGRRHSWFRLVLQPDQQPHGKRDQAAPAPADVEAAPSLFGDLSPEGRYPH